MAIVKCKSCGTEVDENIDKCPRCESLGPKRGKRMRWILAGAFFAIVILFGVGYYVNFYNVKERPYEEIVQERLDDRLSQRAVAAALLLRSHLDKPGEMKLDKTYSNEDGSVLCFDYLEGTKRARAAFVDGELHRDPSAWGLFCVGPKMKPVAIKNKQL